MLFYNFKAGDKEYKLRLTTQAIINLEKKIGMNPLMIFGAKGETVPTVSTMIQVLAAALEPYNHGIGEKETYAIFDTWLNDGNVITDFINIILEIYKVSGLLKQPTGEDNPKN